MTRYPLTASDMARQMLDIGYNLPLPSSLLARFSAVEALLDSVGTALISRQVVALIVADWQRETRGQ